MAKWYFCPVCAAGTGTFFPVPLWWRLCPGVPRRTGEVRADCRVIIGLAPSVHVIVYKSFHSERSLSCFSSRFYRAMLAQSAVMRQ